MNDTNGIVEREYEEAFSDGHPKCDGGCGGYLCDCYGLCPGNLVWATKETVPGYVPSAARLCVECAVAEMEEGS
jgi:hypothetical protein